MTHSIAFNSIFTRRIIFIAGLGLLLQCLFIAGSARAGSFDDITALVKADVPELALAMINRHQPDAQQDQVEWVRWEKQRFVLYEQLKEYDKLNKRIANLPANLPPDFYHWVVKEGINAFLVRGEPAKARKLILKLSGDEYGKPSPELYIELRLLLATSYLLEGLVEDALKTIEIHRHTKLEKDKRWSLLMAKVLLANGKNSDADKLLSNLSGSDVAALKLLVKLRLNTLTADEVIQQASSEKKKLKGNKPAQMPFWALIATASKQKLDYKSQLWALEKVLVADTKDYLFGRLFDADADSLWEAYRLYAKRLISDAELDSDETDLFTIASEMGKKELFDSRSLYAFIAIEGETTKIRERAHREFIKTLYLNRLGHRVANRLYLDSTRFAQMKDVPKVIRNIMIGKALKMADIPLASRLLGSISEVPDGIDPVDWRMRTARVHILVGKFQQGMQVLLELFKDVDSLSNKQVDRLLQVLFDLQALGKHRTAYPLFETLMNRTQDVKRKREILYWMADSMKSLEEHEEAARLYLMSAGLDKTKSMDLWAQSARYQAGESLSRAGLVLDAKQVLTGLLSITSDKGRRALLKQQIEKLKMAGRL